jgi:hypothetical protein
MTERGLFTTLLITNLTSFVLVAHRWFAAFRTTGRENLATDSRESIAAMRVLRTVSFADRRLE